MKGTPMRYYTKCILPDTHETIAFDENGVCNICRNAEKKHKTINWTERKRMLDEIVEQYRGSGQYDCIVPFSGGKDSTFQLWYVITQLKLKPLVVRFNHFGYRPLVDENNTRTFKILGADVLDFTANWHVVKKLMLASLQKTGDFCWHCHTGFLRTPCRLPCDTIFHWLSGVSRHRNTVPIIRLTSLRN